MMKRLVILLLFAAVAAGALALLLTRDRSPWSTDSPAALEAFEACLDSRMKIYWAEARERCLEAVEADPGFLVARLMAIECTRAWCDREERRKVLEELAAADLEALRPRERFLVRYALADDLRDDEEEARRILDDYLAEHPRDPFALDEACWEAWERREWEEAEACYRRLLETDPNWVRAQNFLGYIALAQGDFDEALDLFETYRFVAPDQANPHDSLGELLTLVGRYEEAEREFERAIATRADFCSAYWNQVRLHLLWRRFDAASRVLEQAAEQPECAAHAEKARCSLEMWRLSVEERDWEGAWRLFGGECAGLHGDVMIIGHEAAVKSGRLEEALALEREFGEHVDEAQGIYREIMKALVLHMQATRLAATGDPAAAAERFAAADRNLRYWHGEGLGVFKLFNQANLAHTLDSLGRDAQAEEVRSEIAAVNPRFAEMFCREGDAARGR